MDDTRITNEPGKRSGQPCIRSMRITVWDVLRWLAAGKTENQIIGDYPEFEKDDFRSVYNYAPLVGRGVNLRSPLYKDLSHCLIAPRQRTYFPNLPCRARRIEPESRRR